MGTGFRKRSCAIKKLKLKALQAGLLSPPALTILAEHNLRWLFWLPRLQALTCKTKMGGFMSKALFVAVLAAALIAAPLPVLTQTAAAQTTQPAAPEKKSSQGEEAADAGPARRARAAEEVRRRMEGSQGRRQDREGNEVAEILERLQQAP